MTVGGNSEKSNLVKNFFTVFLLITFFFGRNCIAQFDTTTLNSQTVYFFLISRDSTKNEKALKCISDSTSAIDPYSLIVAAARLYRKGYKDSAMYWLWLGDIRARFLASLYKESSDAALYLSLHPMIVSLTKEYAKTDIKTLYKKINQALDLDSLNPLNPVRFLDNPNDTSQFIPVDEWQHHYDLVRQAYRNLENEILLNGNSIFEEDQKKIKPK